MGKTLIIIKPDGIQRQFIGEILSRFEKKGFKILAMKMVLLKEDIVREHYNPHKGKHFYEPLVRFVTSGPVVLIVLEGVDAVNTATERLNIDRAQTTAAIVGAAGSIGRGISLLLSETVPRLILIGNPNNQSASERLKLVAAEIYRYQSALLEQGRTLKPGSMGHLLAKVSDLPKPDAPMSAFEAFAEIEGRRQGLISFSTDIDAVLARADIVISATSATEKVIHAGNLKEGAIVCDISRPANVSEEVDAARSDVLVIDGGVIEVPGQPSLGWDFGFEEGLAYACMADG